MERERGRERKREKLGREGVRERERDTHRERDKVERGCETCWLSPMTFRMLVLVPFLYPCP